MGDDAGIKYTGFDSWFKPQLRTKMSALITIDKAGRVVIPKAMREKLHLEPGDSLEMERDGDQITLRPVRGTGPLTREHGVWVLRTSAKANEGFLRYFSAGSGLLWRSRPSRSQPRVVHTIRQIERLLWSAQSGRGLLHADPDAGQAPNQW